MSWKIILVLLIGFAAWAYRAIIPPPPLVLGSPGGPVINGPRIKLRDGRYLAYKEHGVPKEIAKYNFIYFHGMGSNRDEPSIISPEVLEKLGIHVVGYDRPGYGESDPDPKRGMKSTALDIEEVGDQLQLGPKFYIIGVSMGGQPVWGCLKYIPHRLAGAVLVSSVVNHWWSGFPSELFNEVYYEQFVSDQWSLRVTHYAPWLHYWWNTQQWFPSSSVESQRPNMTAPDAEAASQIGHKLPTWEYGTQQGRYESLHRDTKIGFGKWEFSPMELDNPFPNGQGSVHLWHGDYDGMVSVKQQRYIAKKLPWIKYHELPDAGHLFFFADTSIQEAVFNLVLT